MAGWINAPLTKSVSDVRVLMWPLGTIACTWGGPNGGGDKKTKWTRTDWKVLEAEIKKIKKNMNIAGEHLEVGWGSRGGNRCWSMHELQQLLQSWLTASCLVATLLEQDPPSEHRHHNSSSRWWSRHQDELSQTTIQWTSTGSKIMRWFKKKNLQLKKRMSMSMARF